MCFGVYVKHKTKYELNGTAENWDRAQFLRRIIIDGAKVAGYLTPTIIIRVEPEPSDFPDKF
jgi:hypothetical protein